MRRCFWPALSAALLCALCAAELSSMNAAPVVKAFFSPGGKERPMGKMIVDQLESAQREIVVAMYQFTYPALAQALIKMSKRVKVRVILDAHQVKSSFGQEKTLRDGGVDVRLLDLPGGGADAPKFHHKYCVIDGQRVLTGSYNWTVLADEENHENVLLVEDAATAKLFQDRFEKLWKEAK
ncbi:MAG: hypothetical protein HZA54_03915 [Planctomycetes bacterium]|nr:hypothetical protein [Planctomycetota bacterium]